MTRKRKPSTPPPSKEPKPASSYILKYRPVHTKVSHSLLSPDAPSPNFRGFINLMILVLFVANARLVIENFIKYGSLIGMPGRNISGRDYVVTINVVVYLVFSGLLSFVFEKVAVRVRIGWLIAVNCLGMLVVPMFVVWSMVEHAGLGIFVLMFSLTLFMKLVSYHLVNNECRMIRDKKIDGEMGYPDNINVKNFIDFICVPTLCYQLEYPRTDRVRKGYVLRRVVELISSLLMIHFLLEQYATPTVQNSLKPMVEKNVPMIIERLLKLSLSSLYIWLLMFYSFFHCYLGIFAELTRFGDREFYLDWWNARDVGTYWRQWNIPVHSWLKRHMYLPLRRRGISGIMCQIVVFLVSSLLHEIAVGIPTHVIQGWAFMGMIIQIPLIMITDMIQRIRPESHLGNYIFWMSFVILGQPMCVLLYYRGWYVKNELIN